MDSFSMLSSLLMFFCVLRASCASRGPFDSKIRLPSDGKTGTQWAVLVAGSSGYWNYRHQADVCHAYQILKKGGLKDENIVVFMYDDIANHPDNPRPGIIINSPQGQDVYAGVPKDYTHDEVNVKNLFAVIHGDRESVKGGSGKVVKSGPDDYVFIYYTDHGGPGVLGMPSGPSLYANDLIDVLKQKHANGTYKEMVIYVEACESGSIFEGLLPEGMNIYVTTASNAEESSWGTYCPGVTPEPPAEYDTCLGDLYSVAWMEDSEVHNTIKETFEDQYVVVKDRTSNHNSYDMGSHVMQYGDMDISKQPLAAHIGFDPSNANATFENRLPIYPGQNSLSTVEQRDADLIFLWQKYKKSKPNTREKTEAQEELVREMAHRTHVDRSVELLGKLLYGAETGPQIIKTVRPHGEPLVDDWHCLKRVVNAFESQCGPLLQYGMKHMRAFANICNSGISFDTISKISAEACRSSLPNNAYYSSS